MLSHSNNRSVSFGDEMAGYSDQDGWLYRDVEEDDAPFNPYETPYRP